MNSLAENHIYVVGPLKAQNELLGTFLRQETGAECETHDHIWDFRSNDNRQNSRPFLILWDCFSHNCTPFSLASEYDGKEIFIENYVAIFNATLSLGIEEEAFYLGVSGIFYTHDTLDNFIKGVHTIFSGELWAPRSIMSKCIMNRREGKGALNGEAGLLTTRESEIMQLIACGHSNTKIADDLCISSNTVKTHLYNIYKKINVLNRHEASIWCRRNL